MELSIYIVFSTILVFSCPVSCYPVYDGGYGETISSDGGLEWLLSIFAITSIVFVIIGCLCCEKQNSYKEYRGSRNGMVMSSSQRFSGQPNQQSEFQIFPPPMLREESEVYFEPLPDIKLRKMSNVSDSGSALRPAMYANAIGRNLSASDWFDEPHKNFPRNQLQYLQELGTGWFGKVVIGDAQYIIPEQKTTKVVVKILREDSSMSDQMYFLHEIKQFRDINNKNVLRLLGRCLEIDPFLVILEHSAHGNLKSFLIQRRKDIGFFEERNLLLKFCCDIANGLKALHASNFIHIDLAVRNCLLSEDFTVKIGDYGQSIQKFKADYYCAMGVAVPIRWCAPESLRCTDTTIETKQIDALANIWSFGVIMWELLEFGKLPYMELSDDEVIQRVLVENKERLRQPLVAYPHKDKMFKVMQLCCNMHPHNRPSIEMIYAMLTQLQSLPKQASSSNTFGGFDQQWKIVMQHSNGNNGDDDPFGKIVSPSLINLNGSLDDLDNPHCDKDNLEESIIEPSSVLNANHKIQFDSLTDADMGIDEEDWSKIVESSHREATEIVLKLKEKSQSIHDFMKLTHVDSDLSDSDGGGGAHGGSGPRSMSLDDLDSLGFHSIPGGKTGVHRESSYRKYLRRNSVKGCAHEANPAVTNYSWYNYAGPRAKPNSDSGVGSRDNSCMRNKLFKTSNDDSTVNGDNSVILDLEWDGYEEHVITSPAKQNNNSLILAMPEINIHEATVAVAESSQGCSSNEQTNVVEVNKPFANFRFVLNGAAANDTTNKTFNDSVSHEEKMSTNRSKRLTSTPLGSGKGVDLFDCQDSCIDNAFDSSVHEDIIEDSLEFENGPKKVIAVDYGAFTPDSLNTTSERQLSKIKSSGDNRSSTRFVRALISPSKQVNCDYFDDFKLICDSPEPAERRSISESCSPMPSIVIENPRLFKIMTHAGGNPGDHSGSSNSSRMEYTKNAAMNDVIDTHFNSSDDEEDVLLVDSSTNEIVLVEDVPRHLRQHEFRDIDDMSIFEDNTPDGDYFNLDEMEEGDKLALQSFIENDFQSTLGEQMSDVPLDGDATLCQTDDDFVRSFDQITVPVVEVQCATSSENNSDSEDSGLEDLAAKSKRASGSLSGDEVQANKARVDELVREWDQAGHNLNEKAENIDKKLEKESGEFELFDEGDQIIEACRGNENEHESYSSSSTSAEYYCTLPQVITNSVALREEAASSDQGTPVSSVLPSEMAAAADFVPHQWNKDSTPGRSSMKGANISSGSGRSVHFTESSVPKLIYEYPADEFETSDFQDVSEKDPSSIFGNMYDASALAGTDDDDDWMVSATEQLADGIIETAVDQDGNSVKLYRCGDDFYAIDGSMWHYDDDDDEDKVYSSIEDESHSLDESTSESRVAPKSGESMYYIPTAYLNDEEDEDEAEDRDFWNSNDKQLYAPALNDRQSTSSQYIDARYYDPGHLPPWAVQDGQLFYVVPNGGLEHNRGGATIEEVNEESDSSEEAQPPVVIDSGTCSLINSPVDVPESGEIVKGMVEVSSVSESFQTSNKVSVETLNTGVEELFIGEGKTGDQNGGRLDLNENASTLAPTPRIIEGSIGKVSSF